MYIFVLLCSYGHSHCFCPRIALVGIKNAKVAPWIIGNLQQ